MRFGPEAATPLRRHQPGAGLAALFFVVGLLTLGDFGETWDEAISYDAGKKNLQDLGRLLAGGEEVGSGQGRKPSGGPVPDIVPGYQYVFDTLRAAFARGVTHALGLADDLPAFHLFNLLLSSSALLLVHALALEVSGSPRVALLSSSSLMLLPKFIGHSQNNPKDMIGLVVFTAAILVAERVARGGSWRAAVGGGAVLGLAIASHVLSVLLVPFAALRIAAGIGSREERRRWIVLFLAAGAGGALLFWPWLWSDPIYRTLQALKRVLVFSFRVPVLYLGDVYERSSPPLHYLAVSLAASTPLVILALVCGGLARLRNGGHEPGPRRLAALALLWCTALLAADAGARSHYDGVRHFLAILPALALLCGLGLDGCLSLLGRLARGGARERALAAVGIAALSSAGGALLWQLAEVHPYHDAYLNEAANALLPEGSERYLEVEYWAQPYKEGAQWLNEHAEPGAIVLVPFAPHCARRYVRDDARVVEKDDFQPGPGPQYLMLMPRRAFFTAALRRIEEQLDPVFTVRRQKGTLLRIYRWPEPAAGARAEGRGSE